MALMGCVGALADSPAPPIMAKPPERDTRTPENLSARQAKRSAKLARRAAKAQHDAELARVRHEGR